MKKSKVSEQLLKEVDKLVYKKKDYKDYIIALIYLVGAIALSIILLKVDFGKDALFFTLWLVVCVAVMMAIIKLFTAKNRYFVKETKQLLACTVLYFEGLSPENLITLLKGDNYKAFKKYFSKEEKGLKLEILTSADGSFARCMVFKFIPYNYETVSEAIALSSQQVTELLSLQNSK